MAAPTPLRSSPQAMKAFDDQHLQIRSWSWYAPPRFALHMSWWGGGPGLRWGVGSTLPVFGSIPPGHAWAVYEGEHRLTVPDYLDRVGDEARKYSLEDDLRRARTWSNVWAGTGAVGIATTIVAVMGMETARSHDAYAQWSLVGSCGLVGMLVGVLGYDDANSRQTRLTYDFGMNLQPDEAQATVESYNRKLQAELGLTDREVRHLLQE